MTLQAANPFIIGGCRGDSTLKSSRVESDQIYRSSKRQIDVFTHTLAKAASGYPWSKKRGSAMTTLIERLFQLKLASSIPIEDTPSREERIAAIRALLAEICETSADQDEGSTAGSELDACWA